MKVKSKLADIDFLFGIQALTVCDLHANANESRPFGDEIYDIVAIDIGCINCLTYPHIRNGNLSRGNVCNQDVVILNAERAVDRS